MKLRGRNSYANTWVVKDNVWELKFVRSAGDFDEDGGNLGLCDPMVKTIYIKTGLRRGEVFKTFIHEILHAIEDEYEIEVDHSIIDQFEVGIAEFMLENLTAITNLLDLEAKR